MPGIHGMDAVTHVMGALWEISVTNPDGASKEVKKNVFAMGPGAEDAHELIRSLEPVKLQLGDLSDITAEMSIEEFMSGHLPAGFKCRWPSNDDPGNPSNYDGIVKWTAEQMKNYRSIFVRSTFAIYCDGKREMCKMQ